jgi:hypothetical protein
MRGIETRKRAGGTSVYLSYTRPDGKRVREVFRFIEEGKAFQKRLDKAIRDAGDERDIRVARLKEGRPDIRVPEQRRPAAPSFLECVSG